MASKNRSFHLDIAQCKCIIITNADKNTGGIMSESKLLDKKTLAKKHPALGARRYRIDWLVRAGILPFVRIGRNIYFEEGEINEWIEKQKISSTR